MPPFLARHIPTREQLARNRFLRWLEPFLHHTHLWVWSRHGVALGVAIGVFFGLLIPIAQIPFSVGAAVVLRANVPAAAASTLVTNPITFAPVYYAAYRVGARLSGADVEAAPDLPVPLAGDADERSLWQRIGDVGTPLITGLAVFACSAGLGIYLLINLVWALVEQWRARKSRAP